MKLATAITATVLLALSARAERFHQDDADTRPPNENTSDVRAQPRTLESAIQDALRASVPSVVRVWFGEGDMLTGTIISSDGLVLTCAHLPVPAGGDVQIGLSDGRRAHATVLSRLPKEGESNLGKDIALLQITEGANWPAATVAMSAPLNDDEPFLALGFPDTLLYGADRESDPLYVRLGHAIRNPYQTRPEQLTTTIHGVGGDSGGPLLNLNGHVIGVVHGGDMSGAHMDYTRIEVLRAHWDQLAPGRTPPPNVELAKSTIAPLNTNMAIAASRGAVVEICSSSRWVALGCVVGDGLILTKFSELGSNLTVVVGGSHVGIAEVAASDPERDLALLRLSYAPELTKGIQALQWKAIENVRAGTPVTLATPQFLAPITGVTCFAPRAVPRIQGCLPCQVNDVDGTVEVVRVLDELRGFRLRKLAFPLRGGDVIIEIEGIPIQDAAGFNKLVFDTERIGTHPNVSGEPISVKYRRGESTSQISVVLEFNGTPSGQLVRPVSNRYSSFPSAIATDLSIRPEHCGAPVVDSSGRLVGLLIARAPFIESLVIPAGEVEESLKGMISAMDSGK